MLGLFNMENYNRVLEAKFKRVFLHIFNQYASKPFAQYVHLQKAFENYELVLNKICEDSKIFYMLDQRSGFAQFSCFYVRWIIEHDNYTIGNTMVIKFNLTPKIKYEKVKSIQKRMLLPPLHMKLGLFKLFIKALNKDGDCFKYQYKKSITWRMISSGH